MKTHYDVIIIGGGPSGIALAIELGQNNIKTLVLEKHEEPLLSPRATMLNGRTIELAMRWKLAGSLRDSSTSILGDIPRRWVLGSKLNGDTYLSLPMENEVKKSQVSSTSIQLPLYETERLLRNRLQCLPSVKFIKSHVIQSVKLIQDNVSVTVCANA